MHIKFIEIQNFRKLKSIRIDFNQETTLFVGANNSGKTSAMLALSHFLIDSSSFTTNDFTLSNWAIIEKIANNWEAAKQIDAGTLNLSEWESVLPCLDVWLDVGIDEVHYVQQLLPTLDWAGGLLGVRLRFEPDDLENLYKEYLTAIGTAKQTRSAGVSKLAGDGKFKVKLWPESMRSFLDRKMHSFFTVKAYVLDPAKCQVPANGIAAPQSLPRTTPPLDGNPLKGIVRINQISAQRGLGETGTEPVDYSEEVNTARGKQRLSEQLRSYYSKHLDPSDSPEPADLEALEALENSQKVFDDRLAVGFASAIKELESLNYPGITDPKLKIATRIRPTDGLNHNAAVQYEVLAEDGKTTIAPLRLPEHYNGLGYQNLICIVFQLMSFRDAWMRVGKAGKAVSESSTGVFLPPLHLVLVEEPEAHLHPQVQQVFVRKAFDILRNHADLGEKTALQTQLIVSTHSSHVAHETVFASLRYFRRLPPRVPGEVPISAVVNLSEVFGEDDETAKFVTRYLRSTHCDLFFADAAIFVEGAAERMLVPHFIRKHFPALYRSYITLLEVGGSHAHQLKPLIERLGLTTLIITDLDSVEPVGRHKSAQPKKGCGQITANATLKTWLPVKNMIDDLLDLPDTEKVKAGDIPGFSVRVAYQIPIQVKLVETDQVSMVLTKTFEDSLAFENLVLFKSFSGGAMAKAFRSAIESHDTIDALGAAFFEALKIGEKAEFALDLLSLDRDPTELQIPKYISDGLIWLEKQLFPEPLCSHKTPQTP